ncbi:MAG: isocitrate lyase/phosphoenolpyruvate mutase family protein [Acidobacteriota bacterium]
MRAPPELKFCNGRALRVIGVHDPLSAIVASGGAWDALWVSSFGVSASSFGLSDIGLVTLSEMMDTVRRMKAVSDVPIILDADTGYGDLLNVRRLVLESTRVGVDGVCIEDAAFPKRNSFLDRTHRCMASVDEMCGRVAMAARTRGGRGPLVIARTEALNQALPMAEAIARAAAYTDAGADAILVHSSDPSGDEVFRFAAEWDRPVPLVVVPTRYPDVPLQRYDQAGIGAVILANQLLRASFRALRETSEALAAAAAPDAVSPTIDSMEAVHEALGTLRQLELADEVSRQAATQSARSAAAARQGGGLIDAAESREAEELFASRVAASSVR